MAKKIPTWGYIVGGVVVVGGYLLYKDRSNKQTTNATPTGDEALSEQSFIPIVSENVSGVGAGYVESPAESQRAEERELQAAQRVEQTEISNAQRKQQAEQNKSLLEYLSNSSTQNQTAFMEIVKTIGSGGSPGAVTASGTAGSAIAGGTVQPAPITKPTTSVPVTAATVTQSATTVLTGAGLAA